MWETGPPSVVTDAGETLTLKTKRGQRDWDNESQRFRTNRRSQCVDAFSKIPKDPHCAERRMTKTTRWQDSI